MKEKKSESNSAQFDCKPLALNTSIYLFFFIIYLLDKIFSVFKTQVSTQFWSLHQFLSLRSNVSLNYISIHNILHNSVYLCYPYQFTLCLCGSLESSCKTGAIYYSIMHSLLDTSITPPPPKWLNWAFRYGYLLWQMLHEILQLLFPMTIKVWRL